MWGEDRCLLWDSVHWCASLCAFVKQFREIDSFLQIGGCILLRLLYNCFVLCICYVSDK